MATEESPVVSDEVIGQFGKVDIGSIADVLYGFGLNCLVQGIPPMGRGMRMCGRAFTMRFVPEQDPGLYKTETSLPQVLPMLKPGDVWVIDNGGRTDCCVWGGHITKLAKRQGVVGVVVDGATRDSAELLETGLPVFARGGTVLHHHGIVRAVNINSEPVQIGVQPRAASVAPGDLVIGDDDGIVIIPAKRAEEILRLSQERQQDGEVGWDPDQPMAHFSRIEINWGFNRILSAYKK